MSAGPFGSPVAPPRPRADQDGPAASVVSRSGPAAARARLRAGPDHAAGRAADPPGTGAADAAELPWYEVAHARLAAVGRRDCGPLEHILHREWAVGTMPPPQLLRAVDRLAELPRPVARLLASGLDAIHVGQGGVPGLDDMSRLRGVPLPSGRATWDSCAGAYGERKILVGSRPSAAPDVMCHEVGHALDDIDAPDGEWLSDSAPFQELYERCRPLLASDFHKQPGPLGRREFFADAFSAIASRQRPALVDMLGGNTRTALDVMLFFNTRYGI